MPFLFWSSMEFLRVWTYHREYKLGQHSLHTEAHGAGGVLVIGTDVYPDVHNPVEDLLAFTPCGISHREPTCRSFWGKPTLCRFVLSACSDSPGSPDISKLLGRSLELLVPKLGATFGWPVAGLCCDELWG